MIKYDLHVNTNKTKDWIEYWIVVGRQLTPYYFGYSEI